jgi:hypothetical protein
MKRKVLNERVMKNKDLEEKIIDFEDHKYANEEWIFSAILFIKFQ